MWMMMMVQEVDQVMIIQKFRVPPPTTEAQHQRPTLGFQRPADIQCPSDEKTTKTITTLQLLLQIVTDC